ncbi:MAG TPA: hypothetical protein VFR97_11650 [Capillimicrobium sp.]|nr:hypothetical protein [Capillimicrobium sp.]
MERDEMRRGVKETYGFADWARPEEDAAPAQALMRRRPFLTAPDLGASLGLRFARRTGHAGARAYTDVYAAAGEEVQLSALVDERATVEDAHEGLVDLLATTMAVLPSCAERGLEIGDVCFCGVDDPPGLILFTRGRIVARVASVGARPVDVTPFAQRLDEQIAGHLRAVGG